MILPLSTILAYIEIGDLIRINDWDTYYTVCGTSDNYILAHHGDEYTIILRWPTTFSYNGIPAGAYVCAPDFWTLGYHGGYDFDNPTWVKEYMQSLEGGETEMSVRHRAQIARIEVKPAHGYITND